MSKCQIKKRAPYTLDTKVDCGQPAVAMYMGKFRVCAECKAGLLGSSGERAKSRHFTKLGQS